jgi:uncharacterized protein YndB with AHSA1/START domain
MLKTNLHQQIFIDALPTKVWKVLTHYDYVNQYFPEENIHSQWTEGSAIVLKREEKETKTLQKGKVLQVVPGVLLKYKLLEELANNFITITYELIPAEEGIELKFYSEGFDDTDEDYLFRINQARLLLQKIKWLAEYA